MSVDLVAAALWLPLEPARKLVLIALCERADFRTGLCWPGREEIAIRASLSARRTSPHLAALEADGWIRHSERRVARHGGTTRRWLDVDRILAEAEKVRADFRTRQLETLGDDTSPDPFQPSLLGDDPDTLGDDPGIDQGTIATTLGDAVTLETVRDPSEEPSDQPSTRARAREARGADVFGSEEEQAETEGRHPLTELARGLAKIQRAREEAAEPHPILGRLAGKITAGNMRTYVEPCDFEISGDELEIRAPNAIVRDWWQRTGAKVLKDAAADIGVSRVEVRIAKG